MKTTWQRLLGMAVLSVGLMRCFTSSSGGDAGTCSAFVQSASSTACGTCVQAKCAAQISAAEQPCADFVSCICGSDGTAQSCASKLAETSCQPSSQAVQACAQNNCSTQCEGVDASAGDSSTADSSAPQEAGQDSTVESGPEAGVDSSSGMDSSVEVDSSGNVDEGIEDSSTPDTFVADVATEAAPEAAAEAGPEAGPDAGCAVAGQTSCNGTCTDTTKDSANCGTCGTTCTGGETCQSSTCLCTGTKTFCNGACTDTTQDNSNCGMCGVACTGGQVCAAGKCGTVCTPPTTTCSGTCTNTSIDPNNCGSCGKACGPFLNAAPGCDQGSCVYGCNAGYLDCTSTTGCEVNGQTDLSNCGACGAVCGPGHDAPACTKGVCSLNCQGTFKSCDSNNANGCEDDTSSDLNNCGSCGKKCGGTFLNAVPACQTSTCGFACTGTFQDCDSSKTGCDSDSQTDVNNCGGCSNACPAAAKGTNQTPTCSGATCGFMCSSGYTDCNAKIPGCETNTASDVGNCGGCGTVCGSFTEVDGGISGAPSCSGGVCSLNCIANWASCDGDNSNGCETETDDNYNHCGDCATACTGSQYCYGGVCNNPIP